MIVRCIKKKIMNGTDFIAYLILDKLILSTNKKKLWYNKQKEVQNE